MVDRKLLSNLLYLLEFFYNNYFKVEIKNLKNLPEKGPALLVGNHSGAVNSPDMLMLFVAWYRKNKFKVPLYGLAHDIFFKIPILSSFITKLGAIPATQESAHQIFKNSGFIVVYPGGDLDAFRSYKEKNKINFFGRCGFIRLAIKENVPIIPVVSTGGHDTLIIFSSGRELAKKLKFDKLFRLNVLPFSFSIPWGFSIGPFLPYIPFPAKIKFCFGKPIEIPKKIKKSEYDITVDKYYKIIENKMQKIMDEMIKENV